MTYGTGFHEFYMSVSNGTDQVFDFPVIYYSARTRAVKRATWSYRWC